MSQVVLFFILLALMLAGCGSSATSRVAKKTTQAVSIYRHVVLAGDLLHRHEERVKEAFLKIGMAVVPVDAVFLNSENIDSRDTCEANVEIHKLINTTVALVLRDYLTREVVWSSSETVYLEDSIRPSLDEVIWQLARDRGQADWRKAEAEHLARHNPEEVLARNERDVRMRDEVEAISVQARTRLRPADRQRLDRYVAEFMATSKVIDRISILRDIQDMGKDAILGAMPVMVAELDPLGEVNTTIEILILWSGIPKDLPASLMENIEDCYRHPDEQVKAVANKLLRQIRDAD